MTEAPRTALITGATAGLGAAFARQLAEQRYDLVLVARDEQRLAETADRLASAHGIAVTTLPADLSTEEGRAPVVERLAGVVDLLVNNAGSSVNASFVRSDVAEESRLLELNVHAVMRLTHAVLPGMVARRRGSVVNVSSVSGFGAIAPGSTYPATKAWVTNFSESVGLAVRRYGVRVMALCPGYTRTEFHQRAGIDMSRLPAWAWLAADDVVRDGLRDLSRGRLVSVPDWKYKLAVFGLRHAPTRLVHAAIRDPRGGGAEPA